MLANHLVNDARTGKLCATHEDYGGVFLLGGPWEWTVKRNDLIAWAKRHMIRPAFLFPQPPLLDTVRNVATAEAYRVGTQSHVFALEYRRALLRIAQQINNRQLVAYVPDADGEFAKLKGDDALVLQMRSFLTVGVKSDERLQHGSENWLSGERTADNLVSTNMDWTERVHIPTEFVPAAKSPTEPENARHVKSISGEAKQDGNTGRNILAPVIDTAIRDAGSNDLQAVFLKLRELALQNEPPFNGEIDGDALCYTNSENRLAKLTKAALSKRLKRRRTAEGQ
ncbi:MAG: hypothetical protein ABI167_00675 [Nitrosospira sp.]